MRQPVTTACLKALTSPLKWLLEVFKDYREKQLLAMSYNGQAMYLKKLLDDNFDPNNRRFYIEDNPLSKLTLSNDTLTESLTPDDDLDAVYFANPEFYDDWIDFTVYGSNQIPSQPSHTEVAHYIDRYKLAGKNYDIQFIAIGIGD
jgi:hypothetical protein